MKRDNDFTLLQLVSMMYLGLIDKQNCLKIIVKFINNSECSSEAMILAFSLIMEYHSKLVDTINTTEESRIVRAINSTYKSSSVLLLHLLKDAYYSFKSYENHNNLSLYT